LIFWLCVFWEVNLTDKEKLVRWEQYRTEMENFETRMAELAQSFLELKAYTDAAECAIKAESAKFICGRMPSKF
jgi:hypothetical protein